MCTFFMVNDEGLPKIEMYLNIFEVCLSGSDSLVYLYMSDLCTIILKR